MNKPLDEYVASAYGDVLTDLQVRHVNYVLDSVHFGNELDYYENAHMHLEFIRDRGEEFIRISPAHSPADFFDLRYLLEMLCPGADPQTNRECLEILRRADQNIIAVFGSMYYKCFRRAYAIYENCRNLFGLKMPDGKDLTDVTD